MTRLKCVALATVAALTLASGAARAQTQGPASTPTDDAAEAAAPVEEDESGPTITGAAAVVSDYRFRGLSLSNRDAAIQGTISLTTKPGFFVSVWGSSIEAIGGFEEDDGDFNNGAETEIDVYGGWTGPLGPVTATVGLYSYLYPGGKNLDYFEIYGSVAGTVGPGSVLVGINYAPDQENTAEDNWYVYGDASIGIPDTPITIKGHIGYEDGFFVPALGGDDKIDWLVGVDAKYKALTFGVAYVGNDLNNTDELRFARDGVVFSLTASF